MWRKTNDHGVLDVYNRRRRRREAGDRALLGIRFSKNPGEREEERKGGERK